ncbi:MULTISPECIES: tail fiber assembly protein [unclassified Pseudomonas]|uniref:tail fiber assembly protein n=1 Tax=unclassified Pseudomonas TaxID=196821 RepID=UPI00200F47CB|nr:MULTISPECIES: tail fiber assembly protein [unclassified Pseudomonas]
MKRYVLVNAAYATTFMLVEQVLDTDEGKPANSDAGLWIDVTGDTTAQVGWKAKSYFNGSSDSWVFTELTAEERIQMVTGQCEKRYDEAARWLKFNPLQYKVLLGVASPAEQSAWVAYQEYYVAVSEVKSQSGYPTTINWPVAPF